MKTVKKRISRRGDPYRLILGLLSAGAFILSGLAFAIHGGGRIEEDASFLLALAVLLTTAFRA